MHTLTPIKFAKASDSKHERPLKHEHEVPRIPLRAAVKAVACVGTAGGERESVPGAMNLQHSRRAGGEQLLADRIDRYTIADKPPCEYRVGDLVEGHENAGKRRDEDERLALHDYGSARRRIAWPPPGASFIDSADVASTFTAPPAGV